MATTQLSDIIDIITFRDLAADNLPELTRFAGSGVVATGEFFDAHARASGETAELNFWRDLDPSQEENYSSDDTTRATPEKVYQDKLLTRKFRVNHGWSAMDVTRELQTNTDAMRHIRNRLDTWWARRLQRKLVAMAVGIFNSNVANNIAPQTTGVANDMIVNRAIEDGANATAANMFNREAFTAAIYSMGDHADELSAMVVHSIIEKRIADQDDIVYIRDSDGQLLYREYMGIRLVIDDGVPVVAGATSGFKYITMIFGSSFFGFGRGNPQVPSEIWRDPTVGDGGGEEQLWDRHTWLLHPIGYSNTGATRSEKNNQQNNADMQNGANWRRMVARKSIPVSFLMTNG